MLSSFGSSARAGVFGSGVASGGSGRESRPEASAATSREKKSTAVELAEAHWGVSREISLRKTEYGSWWSETGESAAERARGLRVS